MQLWQWRNSEFWNQHQEALSEAPLSQRWLLFAGKGRRFHFKIEKHFVAQMNCEAGIVAMGLVEPEDLPAFRQVDEMQYLALPDASGALANPVDPVVVPALLEEFPETSDGSNPALEAALEGLLVRELPKVQQAAEQDPVATLRQVANWNPRKKVVHLRGRSRSLQPDCEPSLSGSLGSNQGLTKRNPSPTPRKRCHQDLPWSLIGRRLRPLTRPQTERRSR